MLKPGLALRAMHRLKLFFCHFGTSTSVSSEPLSMLKGSCEDERFENTVSLVRLHDQTAIIFRPHRHHLSAASYRHARADGRCVHPVERLCRRGDRMREK